MNIFKCSGGVLPTGARCVYMKTTINNKGKLEDAGCMIKKSDTYNILPEFDPTSGEVIFQNPIIKKDGKIVPSTDVDPVGPKIIWENLSNHQHGLTFDFRSFSSYDHDHPNYSIKEHNIPNLSGPLSPDTVVDVFGKDKITLVSGGWNDEYVYGKQTIDKCEHCLYGKFDNNFGLTLHKSMKNYSTDIPDWKIYTTIKNSYQPKSFFLKYASDEYIRIYCQERFYRESVDRMTEIMIAVKNGEYINLKEAAINNGMSEEEATSMIRNISIRSKESIYGSINCKKIFELYTYLGNIGISRHFLNIYRSNIVNYLLNYDVLKNLNPDSDNFSTSERFWFTYLVIKQAYQTKIVNPDNLPQWFISQVSTLKNTASQFKIHGKEYTFTTAPEQIADNFIESVHLGLKNPQQLYPSMSSVEEILGKSYKKSDKNKKATFSNIIRSGVKWNITELQTVWKAYSRFYDIGKPIDFWNFINELDDLDYEILMARNSGDGNPSIKKICLINLINGRIGHDADSWDVDIQNLSSGTTAGARPKAKFRIKRQHFWTALAKMGGLKKDKKNKNKEFISDDKIAQLVEESMEKDEAFEEMSSPYDDGIDSDEFDGFSELDPSTGTTHPLIDRGEEWQTEE